MKQFIFRVHRTKVGDETVRILLEPYTEQQMIQMEEGAEFITGTLAVDPWIEP